MNVGRMVAALLLVIVGSLMGLGTAYADTAGSVTVVETAAQDASVEPAEAPVEETDEAEETPAAESDEQEAPIGDKPATQQDARVALVDPPDDDCDLDDPSTCAPDPCDAVPLPPGLDCDDAPPPVDECPLDPDKDKAPCGDTPPPVDECPLDPDKDKAPCEDTPPPVDECPLDPDKDKAPCEDTPPPATDECPNNPDKDEKPCGKGSGGGGGTGGGGGGSFDNNPGGTTQTAPEGAGRTGTEVGGVVPGVSPAARVAAISSCTDPALCQGQELEVEPAAADTAPTGRTLPETGAPEGTRPLSLLAGVLVLGGVLLLRWSRVSPRPGPRHAARG